MSAIEALGYEVVQTGGGCTALSRSDGSYFTLITRLDDPSAPTAWHEPVTVGRYRLDTGDQEGECVDYPSLALAISALHD